MHVYHFSIMLYLLAKVLTAQSFTVMMTSDEYKAHLLAYIAEYDNKKCYVRPGYARQTCYDYCKKVYEYVPSLPYKNAQLYNPKTRLCEPDFFCPKFIEKDTKTNTCKDKMLGIRIQPIDAPPPNYTQDQLMNVTVICEHGVVRQFNGRLDCLCNIGYGSLPVPNLGSKKSFKKCNQPLPISMYFPNFMKVYYDEEYDNFFPYGALPDYWIQLLLYYTRKAKYILVNFFIPVQVQLITIAIPQQPTFQPTDWYWFIYLMLFLVVLLLLTVYEKCVQKLRDISKEDNLQV